MEENKRILVIDDNKSIHEDFTKILATASSSDDTLKDLEMALFKKETRTTISEFQYILDHAFSGEDGLALVIKAQQEKIPYALAIVDQRMPSGWDGIQTISKIWEVDPLLEIVICTAFSDYTWDEITMKLGVTDRLLILKKPFDTVEVKQMAAGVVKKWNLAQQARQYEQRLENEIAISNERLAIIEKQNDILNKEIEMARKIQVSLLPHRIPEMAELNIAFKYVPMMGVGGDLLDIFYNEESSHAGFFICDVVGHGIAAAFLAAMTKMALNTWGDHVQSPKESLYAIRNLLVKNLGDTFITACICTVDISTGCLTYVSAGHPPIAHIRKSGGVELLQAPGRFINSYFDPKIEERKIQLMKGDKLILYTDGISEAENQNGVRIGSDDDQQFIDWFEGKINLGGSPAEICEDIFNKVVDYTESINLKDDFTVMTLEYLGNKNS